MIWTGIESRAPLFLPIIVIVVYNTELVPNKVLTVVAVKLIVVPITVLLTLVPIVVVLLSVWTSGVFIPKPLKLLKVLTSEIVAT